MMRAVVISLVALGFGATETRAQPNVEGGPEWLQARADVFSQVCMAAAPDFARFEELARAAGLDKRETGWVLPPEGVVNLIAHDGFCTCLMAVGAPDQDKMIEAMHGQLMVDWGESFTGKADGLASVAPFQREGVEAVSILEPRKFDGQNWLEARVSVFGACPEPGKLP